MNRPKANGYESLRAVLDRAFDQAAIGKGAERHADNKPFNQQPMQQIADRRGVGFILGQSDKKSEEAQGMANRGQIDAAVRELLGAIVYLAGAVIWLERHQQPVAGNLNNAAIITGNTRDELARNVIGHMAIRSTQMANDNEQPHDCCPVCQHVDGFHHEKCSVKSWVEWCRKNGR